MATLFRVFAVAPLKRFSLVSRRESNPACLMILFALALSSDIVFATLNLTLD